ncbi:MAG TPA: hypothetical protein VEV81_07645, partial [Pyrinomonadaceae bacterium]|nr:hypothetical protein [Pyrinomonadaceae bacterium]
MSAAADPSEYLSAELQRLDLLLHREILRLRAIYQLSLDEFRGLYISDEQVDQLIDRSLKYEGGTSATAELTQRAEALRRSIEEGDRREGSPWSRLIREFSLSPAEQDILLLAVAPEIHLKYETLYAYLNNDVTRKLPTCDLALRLFSQNAERTASVRRSLVSDAILFSGGLLQWNHLMTERPSWLASSFSVSPAVMHYLSDIRSLDPPVTSFAELRRPAAGWGEVPVTTRQGKALRRFAELLSSPLTNRPTPVVILAGHEGTGRALAAEAICCELNLTMLCVDLESLRAASDNLIRLSEVILSQLRLQNAALYLERCEALFDKEGEPLPDGRRFLKPFVEDDRLVLLACGPNTRWRELFSRRRVAYFHLADPDYSTRLRLWERA